jgi:hypothetical protein
MTLLRAADMVAPLPPPPAVGQTTLAALAAAAPSPGSAAPRSLFPLIEALDLPGAAPRHDAGAQGAAQGGAQGAARAAVRAAPRPALVPAAEVGLPLSDLFRLLAAGAAGPAEAYADLRRAARAGQPTT